MADPGERSNTWAIIPKVTPTATIARAAFCSSTFCKFEIVKKLSLTAAKRITMRMVITARLYLWKKRPVNCLRSNCRFIAAASFCGTRPAQLIEHGSPQNDESGGCPLIMCRNTHDGHVVQNHADDNSSQDRPFDPPNSPGQARIQG